MGLNVTSTLLDEIEALQLNCASLPLPQLCERLDQVRVQAHRHGYEAVAKLASLLESVVAYNGHRQIALSYFALMRDAARHHDPKSAHVFLAAAALRGCR